MHTSEFISSNKAAYKNAQPFFQPKLSINQPNDVYEQEADAVAEQVLQTKMNNQADTFFKPINISTVQRKCATCEHEEEEKLQRKEKNNAETEASGELENYVGALGSSGNNLSSETNQFFSQKIGYDFSNVKIHTDSVAAKSAQSINALAYTTDNHIVFNQNQYQPETDTGKKLLAHELTHVVQQNGNQNTLQMFRDEDFYSDFEPPAERSTDSDISESLILGALMGEFNEDPTLGQIALDTGISLIPVVDQVADARDITAHLYFMIFRGEVTSIMRWIMLILSLIGLIPEAGSAIKGVGRIVISGGARVLARLAEMLEPFRRYIPGSIDFRSIYNYIIRRWDELVTFTRSTFTSIVNNLLSFSRTFWLRILDSADEIINSINRLSESSMQKITEAFADLRIYFDDVFAQFNYEHAITPDGMSMPIPESRLPETTHMEMSGGSGISSTRASSIVSTYTSEAARYLLRSGGLTYLANQIKRLGQMRGATVEIAVAMLADGRRIMVAGLNSSARWTTEQLDELNRLGIMVAPQQLRGMDAAPHAEENIAAYIVELGGRGERWSRAVVGAGGSYVCSACQSMIRSVGGSIEEGL